MDGFSLFPLTATFALTAFFIPAAAAESHPSWWAYASPDATALVGIHWDALRNSPFGDAVQAELSSAGPLGFPDLDCLNHAREVVISAPELLAAEAGSFPSATVKEQAPHAGLHRLVYRGVTLWIPDSPAAIGIAQISEQLILVGARKTLQSAVDRSLMESGRSYSSLLPRAARFSQTGDLWVVAVRLPDPLANLFVPLDVEGFGFAGQVSVRDGLSAEASFDASSTNAAAAIAEHVEEQAQALPALARGLEATSDRRTVNIELQASPEEIAGALSSAPAAPAPAAQVPAKPATPAVAAVQPATAKFSERRLEPAATTQAQVAPLPSPAPVAPPAPAAPPQAAGPQVVHIIGLDDGPREIVLPPLPAN